MAGLFENLPYTNYHDLNLEWLLKTVKKLDDLYDDLDIDGIFAEIRAAIEGNTEAIEDLNERFQKLEDGDYIENYIPALAQWIDANLQTLVARIAKFVVFGITYDGYFYADIPESWSEVQFSTGYDPEIPTEYLHLILNY